MFKLGYLWGCLFCIIGQISPIYSNNIATHIHHFLKDNKPNNHIIVKENTLFSATILPNYYSVNNFEALWVKKGDLHQANDLVRILTNAQYDGLNPLDYHCNQIVTLLIDLQKKTDDSLSLAMLDILLTDAVLLLSSHLAQGKLNPNNLVSSWEIQRELQTLDFVSLLNNLIQSHSKDSIIAAFCQFTPAYLSLRSEAKKLYKLQYHFENQWEPILADSTLKPNQYYPQIPAIRRRLVWLGETLNTSTADSFFYDSLVASAIMRIQHKNGLKMDAEIGTKTLKALNNKPSFLIQKANANLERYRWLPKPFPKEHLLVNITQFKLFYLNGADTLLQSRAIVGKNYRKTPVFSAQLSYLVLSPTWTVPPGIFTNDVLPAVRKDPDYLRKKNMTVIDRLGQIVPDSLINWNAPRFPYMVRQAPGNQNSLGGVKFMFPNLHNVYIHDTPTKNLFDKEERNFSSGCIRIEKAFELAYILLNKNELWEADSLQMAMQKPHEIIKRIRPNIPVYITYFTAWANNGTLYLRNDIYNRDEEISIGLAQTPRLLD